MIAILLTSHFMSPFVSKNIKYVIVVLSLIISACSSNNETYSAKPKMAIGTISVDQLLSRYNAFNQEFERFQLSEIEKKTVHSWPDKVKVDVFFGTWCHDSEREVPRLLKALSNKVALNLIALDYSKSEPLARAAAANINFTPTFVVYYKDKVIGRIIERPNISLVADIDLIIKNRPLK